jgi:serine/threonine protein kinase
MVDLHLKEHGGDAELGLGSIPVSRATREGLAARLGDADLVSTLRYVSWGVGRTGDGDAARTTSGAVHMASRDGARFRILRPHARGGLGAVFVALDSELHREVALKQILDWHADDPVSQARFLLEAEVTGGLEHPGIVPVYGMGTYADGRPYYAMRFIRGDSLEEAIDRFHADEALRKAPGRRSLELRKLLRRFVDACNAIEYAHSRGVMHRDIKPGNIIVGRHGETLVADWGLAKAVGQAAPTSNPAAELMPRPELPLSPAGTGGYSSFWPSSESGGSTPGTTGHPSSARRGVVLGTPWYMSPEQAEGDLDRVGPMSDIYSLGATLYHLVTGWSPFLGDDVHAVLIAVRRGEFLPPRALDPSINPALEAVCLKAMALEPRDRYTSATELAADIGRWMAGEPVAAWHRPRRFPLSRLLSGLFSATRASIVGESKNSTKLWHRL